ncbi:hypothetical protein [Hymenobacter koreensis]|uniref:Uncharacterized protein n=1 Tax=Hymenobacter koreensis TaxID=1084523 RepID=A0ABP8IVJ1_9BACT
MTKNIPQPITAAPQGLPPARPNDPLRSPRPRKAHQPGHGEEAPAPERSQPAFAAGRWC